MSTTTRHIELAAGEALQVAGCTITLVKKSGQRARISVHAPPGLQITHPINRSAHECAPTPAPGKEHSHGQYPI